jgi:hypothetical protein
MSTVSSSVSAVTVFRRGAMVTRVAELHATSGAFPGEVTLQGLPLTLEDDSLRIEVVAVDGHEGGLPIAGDAEVTVAVAEPDARLPPAHDEELLAARLQHEQARREFAGLQRALARAESIAVVGRGEPEEGKPPIPSPTAARTELLALRRARAGALHARVAAAKENVRTAAERLATLEERARVASTARNARAHEVRKAAVIRLAAPPDAGAIAPCARLLVSYFVPGARWAPAYTVRLDRDMDRGTLELRALVGQTSGEDWSGVALTLSTASTQRWTELPELRTMRIGRAQPPVARTGWRAPPVGAADLYADYDRDLGAPSVSRPVSLEPDAELARLGALADQLGEDMMDGSAEPKSRRARVPAPSAAPAAMAPPPPQAAPPMPMTYAAPARSSGLASMVGDAFGGIAGGVGAMFGAPPPRGGPQDLAAATPAAPEIALGRALLDYGRLRLASADDPRRGALHRAPPHAGLDSRVVETMRAAGFAAASLEHRDAPAGHVWPGEEDGFAHVILADAPVDVASDGKLASVPILARAIEAAPRFVTVPRESLDVFRVVALRNPLEAPVLAGPADVYVAGRFTLASQLPTTPAGGRIELGLGVEQAIKIARNVQFEEDTSGLLKRQHALLHTIEIRIANHLGRAARVEVRERLPVPAEDQASDIGVEVVDVTPAWDEYEQKPEHLEGGRAWKVEVAAGAELELRAVWVAKIPSQHEIIGGNRRES